MNLDKVFKDNSIYYHMHKGSLITAGNKDKFNTMTIGWGVTGVLWGKDVFIAYVRPSRYTYQFMEENEYFTISYYDEKYQKELGYLGTTSGRNCDKIKDVNFHPLILENGVTFAEASLTIVCKKLYFQDLDENQFPNDVLNRYYPYKDIHRYYIGEIINIIEK